MKKNRLLRYFIRMSAILRWNLVNVFFFLSPFQYVNRILEAFVDRATNFNLNFHSSCVTHIISQCDFLSLGWIKRIVSTSERNRRTSFRNYKTPSWLLHINSAIHYYHIFSIIFQIILIRNRMTISLFSYQLSSLRASILLNSH